MREKSEAWLWLFRIGIGFILLTGLLFCIGFSTNYWSNKTDINIGLWAKCTGALCTATDSDLPAYFVATQAFQTMSLIMYTLSPIVHFFVYLGTDTKSDGLKTRIFDIGYIIGAIFHLCSILIFGLEMPEPDSISWSYNMSAASLGLVFVGVLLVIYSRKRALRNFGFFPNKDRGRHNRRVATTPNSSSIGSPSVTSSGSRRSDAFVRHDKVFGPASRNTGAQHQSVSTTPQSAIFGSPSASHAFHANSTPVSRDQSWGFQRHHQHPEAFPQGGLGVHHNSATNGAMALGPIRGAVPSAPPLNELPTYEEAVSNR